MNKERRADMNDLGHWLEDLGLSKYAQNFRTNEITYEDLPDLTADDLKDIGIQSLLHRKKMLRAIAALSEEMPVTVEPGFAGAPARFSKITPRRYDAERRQLTVMFCDLVGSTQLSEILDPEVLVDVIGKYQNACKEVIEQFDGFCARFVGDGVLIYFGYPRALEDDAIRAVRAGLGIVKAVSELDVQPELTLSVRVGIATGKVVVGNIAGDKVLEEDVVVGQAPNLAARLLGIAEPNSVVISSDTHHLVDDWFISADLGQHRLKGFSEPLRVFQVERVGDVRTRFQAATRRGLTHYVGRKIDLDRLRRAQRLAGEGYRQVVAIVGEPGVGKSRLVHEFTHTHRTRDENWLVLESSAVSSGHSMPYLPVIALLKQYFKISDRDNVQSIRNKVTHKISTLKLSQDEVPPILDLLEAIEDENTFRSVDAVQHRQRTYLAVSRLLIAESNVRPVIAIFEDLHQIDSLTLGLLNQLLVDTQDAQLLLVVSYRPEFKDEWGKLRHYHQLRLEPLVSERHKELLDVLLGSDDSLQPLKNFLVERAGGNPFFVEEIVQALFDTGVLDGARGSYSLSNPFSNRGIPLTVQAVLDARIDALEDDARRLLQEAAVIGHEVPFTVLYEISGLKEDTLLKGLKDLEDAEFLYPTKLIPEKHYTFKHSFTREVAYHGLLHKRRGEIHAHIVDVIEDLYADRLSEQVERLAHHAVRGGRQEKAVRYLRLAGKRAAERLALEEARTYFEEALDILISLPESETVLEKAFDIRLELRPVLRQLGEVQQMLEHLREAEAISERLNDGHRLGRVCAAMTTVLSTLDELDEAVETGTRGLEIARRLGDEGLDIVCTSELVKAYFYRGEYERVVKVATHNLKALPEEWDLEYFGMAVPPSVFSRVWLIMSLAELGQFAQAAKYEAEVIQLAALTQHPHTMGWANLAASTIHLCKGDWAKVDELVGPWAEKTATSDVAVLLPWAVGTSAWALAQLDDDKKSEASGRVEECVQCLEALVAQGIVGHRGSIYHAAGRACLLLGRLNDAQRLAEYSIASSERQPGVRAHALHLLGEIATHPDWFDPESGAAYYRKALSLADQQGMRPLVAHCYFKLGKLYRRINENESAHESLAIARLMFGEMDMDAECVREL